MKPRIFISYKHDDPDAPHQRIAEVAAALEAGGVQVLWDPNLQWGEPWRRQLRRWLGQCHGGLVILTAASLQSDWVAAELNYLAIRRDTAPEFVLLPLLVGLEFGAVGAVAALEPAALDVLQAEALDGDGDWPAVGPRASERLARLREFLADDQRAADAATLAAQLGLTGVDGGSLGVWYGRLGIEVPAGATAADMARAAVERCMAARADDGDAAWKGVLTMLGYYMQRAPDPSRRAPVLDVLWPYAWVDAAAAKALAPLGGFGDEPVVACLTTALGPLALEAHLRRAGVAEAVRLEVADVAVTAPDAPAGRGDALAELFVLLHRVGMTGLSDAQRKQSIEWLLDAETSAARRAFLLGKLSDGLAGQGGKTRVYGLGLPSGEQARETLTALRELAEELGAVRVCALLDEALAADAVPPNIQLAHPDPSESLERRAALRFRDLRDTLDLPNPLPPEVQRLLPQAPSFDDLLAELPD